ncbi:alkaline phosphatase [Mycobacterium kyorinense]|uniref:Alkaline phosphatase n=1 Tax=Mycobacterium kyorinense TaxID=487514 RepID=A0A1A2ZCW3_9MYCO|nr:DedA family protein [Mycobacterium kyorinense]OBI47513.1 alkaline phosphatase [Mycobacterium kyorinense]
MSAQLPGILQSLAPILDRHGYAAVVALVGVEGFGIPAPGQTVLIAAGIYAGAGQLNLAVVLALGLVAAVAGDNIGYAIGHFAGRPLVLRFGRYVFLTEDRLATAERFFAKHGNVVVPVARFIDGLRQANGVVAGLAHMRWWRFLAYNVLGAIAWVSLWVLVGYVAGDHITAIYTEFQHYEKYFLAALAAAVIAVSIRWLIKRRRRRSPAADNCDNRPP